MTPTRVRTLVVLAVVVGALSWLLLHILDGNGTTLPPLTWTAPAGVLALAVVVGVAWWSVRRRRSPDNPAIRPIEPLGMARLAALGKAASHVGAALTGLYAGWVLLLLPDLEISSRRDRAVLAGVAAACAVLLVVAGLLLERACRVRDDDRPPAAPAAG